MDSPPRNDNKSDDAAGNNKGKSSPSRREAAAAGLGRSSVVLVPAVTATTTGTSSNSSSSGSGSKKRKPVESTTTRPPECSVCKRSFGSYKALFGHLRSHPERQWRGCYPPPVSDSLNLNAPPSLPHSLPPPGLGGGRGHLNIDLNRHPQSLATDDEEAEAEALEFDLNKPPTSDLHEDADPTN